MFALMGVVLCSVAMAQDETITSTMYDVPEMNGDYYFAMYRVSNNGQWAVAAEGLLSDTSYNSMAAILWSRDTGEYTVINPDYDGSIENGVLACDVSDDGRIVGAYPKWITDEDTGETYQRWWPAYKDLDGDWIDLTVPDSATYYGNDPMDLMYNTLAKRISADGKIIVGESWMYKGNGKKTFEPIQWFLDDDGNVIETRMFDYLSYPSSVGYTVQDMSNDGRIIAGSMTTERGSECYPAMIIDGELVAIAKPNLILQDGYEDYYLEDEEGYNMEPYGWWEGDIVSMDIYGNAYFYYSDGLEQLHCGVYNIETGKIKTYDEIVTCGIPGFICGRQSVIVGQDVSVDGMYLCGNMSDDGTVVAGCGLGYNTLEAWNYPMLYVYSASPVVEVTEDDDEEIEDEETTEDGISSIAVDNSKMEIYTLSGQRVPAPAAKGIYVINGKKMLVR